MNELIIIAGPNGAGKTSFANEYLPVLPEHQIYAQENLIFVNADEIARQISQRGLSQTQIDREAGRKMLTRINQLVRQHSDFAVETTLATLSYAKKIPKWRELGYNVSLIYLRLPSVEHSILRVKRRVESGGHDIPEQVIRRRFKRSLEYLDKIYKPIVSEWAIWDSLEGHFKKAETRDND